MKARLTLFLFLSFVLLATPSLHVYGQRAGEHVTRQTCSVCGKTIQNCPYKGKHPNPQSQPTTGTLSISSTPSDASVKIDGRYLGTTPLTLDNRKAGTYKVTFSAEGYETVTKSVTVTAGKTATCSATLKKKQAPQPAVQQPTTAATTASTSAPSQTITVGSVSFTMIRVEGATSGTFYIGETEVTQALWEAVMGSNPSNFKGANRPVERVSWNDCKEFISRLNSATGKTFRLPTEAEWEFAARGGNRSMGYKYSGSNTMDEVGWYYENSGNSRLDDNNWESDKLSSNGCCTHPVKQKKANELGLYDMSGNVWEWCEDLYDSSGSYRVSCGGCWYGSASYCRVADRYYGSPTNSYYNLGFRLAL